MDIQPAKTLADFDAELATLNLFGQWNADALLSKLTDGPKPGGDACIWRWELVHRKLREACELFPESLRARRNLTFVNTGLPRRGSTQTIIMGMQLVMPGEIAWGHRHTIGALRFTIDGSKDLSTVVDGHRLAMETNDLVLTPQWTWHDHHNDGERDGIWLDVLDVPLIMGLNQAFYEPYGEKCQPVEQTARLPYRYAWRDVEPLLREHAGDDGSPYDGVRFAYVNPTDGGWTLPTMACYVQLLRPGLRTKAHRHTSSAIYYVIGGSGTTIVDGKELDWSDRDAFVVPNWAKHAHVNRSQSDEALLFSVTDEPLLAALGLNREDPEDASRKVALRLSSA
ncbi:MAG TPA: cupin domain-containing protein [Candidatus Binatia bacterium]|nr:cupin domain-containing protein [Candidatus Binatia bacterium]